MDERPAEQTSRSRAIGRQELVKRISQQAQISQKQASEILNASLDSIREALQAGSEVRLAGFGIFKVRQSAARRGVHPRTRIPIQIEAKDRVYFSPSKNLHPTYQRHPYPPLPKKGGERRTGEFEVAEAFDEEEEYEVAEVAEEEYIGLREEGLSSGSEKPPGRPHIPPRPKPRPK